MLTQSEADALIAMEKTFLRSRAIRIPAGTDQTYDLIGSDERERFLLDIWRGTLRISKVKYQTRGRKVVVLVRLDIDGAPHTNPDGATIGGTHLHIYREGFEDKWAYPIDPAEFSDVSDIYNALADFCQYCNIKDIPSLQRGLL